MGGERPVNIEWVGNGIFELCERYKEQAFTLIQKVEKDSRDQVCEYLCEIINDHIKRIEDIMSCNSFKKKALINCSYNNEEIEEYLETITDLTERFKQKILDTTRNKPVLDRIDEADFVLNAIRQCIFELRIKLEFRSELSDY